MSCPGAVQPEDARMVRIAPGPTGDRKTQAGAEIGTSRVGHLTLALPAFNRCGLRSGSIKGNQIDDPDATCSTDLVTGNIGTGRRTFNRRYCVPTPSPVTRFGAIDDLGAPHSQISSAPSNTKPFESNSPAFTFWAARSSINSRCASNIRFIAGSERSLD